MAKIEKYAQGTPSYAELVTPDQAAAKAFYGPLFGWDLEDVPLGDDGYYVAVSKEGDSVAGISGPMAGMEGHPAWWGVYLTVDDVEGLGRQAGGEHGALGVLLVQRAEDRDDLVGGLARAVHDLRVAGACCSVDVDAGEAEVLDPGVP